MRAAWDVLGSERDGVMRVADEITTTIRKKTRLILTRTVILDHMKKIKGGKEREGKEGSEKRIRRSGLAVHFSNYPRNSLIRTTARFHWIIGLFSSREEERASERGGRFGVWGRAVRKVAL